jgi:hypothetical protein
MATLFRNVLQTGIGTTETLVLTTSSNAHSTVIGFSLSNLTNSIVLASVRISDTQSLTSAFFLKNVILPPNQSLRVVNGGEKLVLGPSTEIYIQSNTDDSLDLVMSYIDVI